jgi:hypothetical protein
MRGPSVGMGQESSGRNLWPVWAELILAGAGAGLLGGTGLSVIRRRVDR